MISIRVSPDVWRGKSMAGKVTAGFSVLIVFSTVPAFIAQICILDRTEYLSSFIRLA